MKFKCQPAKLEVIRLPGATWETTYYRHPETDELLYVVVKYDKTIKRYTWDGQYLGDSDKTFYDYRKAAPYYQILPCPYCGVTEDRGHHGLSHIYFPINVYG